MYVQLKFNDDLIFYDVYLIFVFFYLQIDLIPIFCFCG